MTHREHQNTLPTRETERMDTYLLDGRETPERDNTHTDKTTLPEREHQQNIPVKEDKQSSEERQVELVGDGSPTNEQPDVVYLPQLEEDEKNGHAEQVQEERPSSPPAEDAHRENMQPNMTVMLSQWVKIVLLSTWQQVHEQHNILTHYYFQPRFYDWFGSTALCAFALARSSKAVYVRHRGCEEFS
ncbi:hypothetical protein ABVT39_004209 [Epinephelus coioides]